MKKLFVVFVAVIALASCKKEPITNVINVGGNNSGGGTTTLFYDSTTLAGGAYDATAGVGVKNAVGTIRELTSSELPFAAYGSNTVGCEMAIEFTLYSENSGITFSNDQALQINFPNSDYFAQSKDVQIIASGVDGTTKWYRLRMSVMVMRDVNAEPLPLSVNLDNFYYFLNSRPAALAVNLNSNGVNFRTSQNHTKGFKCFLFK